MSNQRVLEVVEDIERTLLELFRKHQVTHDEYRAATDLIIASIKEIVVLSVKPQIMPAVLDDRPYIRRTPTRKAERFEQFTSARGGRSQDDAGALARPAGCLRALAAQLRAHARRWSPRRVIALPRLGPRRDQYQVG